MTITFTDQYSCTDVNNCIADLEQCGAEVQSTSFSQDAQSCDITVIINDEEAFRSQFELTDSWIISNY